MKITPEYISELKENEIFVFGSNLGGFHGAGAAKTARDKFKAKYGTGSGRTGQCYAIPTKDRRLKTLSLKDIQYLIDIFENYVIQNKDLEFLITRIGCGLAGYKAEQIAPLFSSFISLPNISLPKDFIDILRNKNENKQSN